MARSVPASAALRRAAQGLAVSLALAGQAPPALSAPAIGSFVTMSSAALAAREGAVIIGGTHPSRIYAIDATRGRLLWSVRPPMSFPVSL